MEQEERQKIALQTLQERFRAIFYALLILLPSPPLKDAKKTKKERFYRFLYTTSIDSCVQSLYNDYIPKYQKN
jgi:hypothetical protein